MEEKYIELVFEVANSEQGDILIACLNDAPGITGFEENEGQIKAYLPAGKYDSSFFDRYPIPANITYTQTFIENKNWNAVWESGFEPVIIDKFVSIRADFHKNIIDTEYEILITPKMSFGTGHHATTRLMIEALRDNSMEGKRIADFGTGTGVLAILADKMKAAEILAMDYDDWSIENARENIEKNTCTNIRLVKTDHFPDNGNWDVILANINLHVILANMQHFYQGLKPNGLLIISGILQEDRNKLELIAVNHLFSIRVIREKNNWLCITFKKEEAALIADLVIKK